MNLYHALLVGILVLGLGGVLFINELILLSYIAFHFGVNFVMAFLGMFLEQPHWLGKDISTGKRGILYSLFWYPWLLVLEFFLFCYRKAIGFQKTPLVTEIIDNQIYLGGWPSDISKLAEMMKNYKDESLFLQNLHIVDITSELPKCVKTENYLCISTWDGIAPTLKNIEKAVQFCQHAVDKKKDAKILIHCAFGIGRSTTVLCAVLVALGKFKTWQEAFEYVKKKRPIVRLNKSYTNRLEQWQKQRDTMKDQ